MAADPLFVEALLHDEVQGASQCFWRRRILGRRVRPFSIWHEFLLSAIESPLVCGKPANVTDLLRAVVICGSRFPHAEVKPMRFSLRAFWCCLGGGFARQTEAFNAYRADYRSFPDFQIVEERHCEPGELAPPPTPLGPPPVLLRLFADVIGWTKWPREQVWNLPSGEARWYQAMAMRAQRVRVSFVTPELRRELEELEQVNPELHAEFLAAARAWKDGEF